MRTSPTAGVDELYHVNSERRVERGGGRAAGGAVSVADSSRGAWLQGAGWDEGKLADRRY